MKKQQDDLRKIAENMILQDDDISTDDKVEMLDDDLNEDILSDDWGFVNNLQSDMNDIDVDEDVEVKENDSGIDNW